MSDPADEELERRLQGYASEWQTALPDPRPVPHDRLRSSHPSRSKRLWLMGAAAAAVLIAVATPMAVTNLGSDDRGRTGPTRVVPTDPAATPTMEPSDCGQGPAAAVSQSFRFYLDIPIRSAPPTVWTLTADETVEFRALLQESRAGIVDEAPASDMFAGIVVTAGQAQRDFLRGLGMPSQFRVYDAPGAKPSALAEFLGKVERCREESARRNDGFGPGPGEGYVPSFCNHIVFEGRRYEVSEHQTDVQTRATVGSAHGTGCGSAGTHDVTAYSVQERSRGDAIAVFYAPYQVVYVPEFSAAQQPVPYPAELEHAGDVRADDLAAAREFARFAVDPGSVPESGELFSPDGARIGLGPLLHQVGRDSLADPASWSFDPNGFAGWSVSINVLDVVRDYLFKSLEGTGVAGKLQVIAGDAPRCAYPALPTPSELTGLRHLSLQPATGAIDSCLDWFAVDLYLDDSGAIVAVSLDLLEP